VENLKPSPGIHTPPDGGSATSGALRLVRSLSPSSRRRLERDLHDGVQGELVALIVGLGLARQDPDAPPTLADSLSVLEARAQAALDAVRDIVGGIYPAVLVDFGLGEALHALARRAGVDVTLVGTAPRSTEGPEEAVYYACSEAIQNATKHAGSGARCTIRLSHRRGWLRVQIADNGRGFDPERTLEHRGLQNIRDRIIELNGTVAVDSRPGRGTVLTLSLPWPTARPAAGVYD
jgi:signal transduction histidine kinase